MANKNCPSPAPAGTPPPQKGICNAGSGGYWSYSLGDWVYYDGHDGIDFGISYRPVYAAADTDQVVYAGWWDPQNHKVNLGIYVRLHHANGYNTFYGHMSSVAVQACSSPGCTFMPHGETLGISGTTGNSSGPHLHLLVRNPAGKSVDPYGWKGSGADPWTSNQPESLWVAYPALVYYGAQVYPSGEQLAYPLKPATGLIVDDSSVNFVETPAECWLDTSTGSAQGGVMLYSKPRTTAPTCAAQWNLPSGANNGMYSVYVRIPAINATTAGALYSIRHAGKTDQIVMNQEVFPNIYYVTDGWVYIGKYNFTGTGDEYIELTNRAQDEAATIADRFVGADAVRFVFQGAATPTPSGPVTVTATVSPTKTFTPTITQIPTITQTPTITSGHVVRVGDWRMRVIGVLASRGQQLGVDMDDVVIVPVATAMKMLDRRSLFRLVLQVRTHADLDRARERVVRLIADRHGEEDVTAITQDAVLGALTSILGAFTLALAGIASVSLAVAGVGIMNVMLVSVSERTREIGLLKALGAGRRQILLAFLAEAILLSSAGGLLGLLVGWLAVRVLIAV